MWRLLVYQFYVFTFLLVWLAHIVVMLGVTEESQTNTFTARRNEAQGRFWLLHRSNTETDKTRTPKQYTNNCCSSRSP